MTYKWQIDSKDYGQLYDAAFLLEMALGYLGDTDFVCNRDYRDVINHLMPCLATARKIVKTIRDMEVVKVSEPASGGTVAQPDSGAGV